MTDQSQDTPPAGRCASGWAGAPCTERVDNASGLCFLHDPELTAGKREDFAKKRGAESLKAYIEDKVKREESLSGVHLEGANLSGADLQGADLSSAHLERSTLLGAHLERANLSGVHLKGTDLVIAYIEGANLWQASLEGADVWKADLGGANLSDVNLSGTLNLSVGQMEQVEPNVEGYRSFKRAFIEMSRYDDASRAAFLEKEQQQKGLAKDTWQGWWLWRLVEPTWLARFGRWLVHSALGMLCGYFERPWRPVRWSAVIVLLFALVYSLGNAFTPYQVSGNTCGHQTEAGLPAGETASSAPARAKPVLHPTEKDKRKLGMGNAVYCSLVTFTTLGYGDFRPRAGWRLVAAIEAAVGAFMIAIFVVTLSHRFVAR